MCFLLYDIAQDRILPDIVYPGSTSTSAYGIWYNGGTSYTICGGYTTLGDLGQAVSHAYLVDYDSGTGNFSHWTTFEYPNGKLGQNFVTHFQGISGYQKGVYSLSADSAQLGNSNLVQGSWVTVRRNSDGSFGPSVWVDLNYPGTDPDTELTSNDSVAGDAVVGIVISTSGTFSYQADLNVGFQLSNVIGGNTGNGVGIYGGHENQVAQNYIGTNASGSGKLGNGKNGVLITQRATGNMIGGQATGGNNPTGGVFVRPPQGNLISGNRASGVSITGGATRNILSGNFIGTTADGNAALGNRLDGVAIDRADGNALLGCTFEQNPFVFYNVLSGNGGNGLRITNSNNTTVQANFMGVGADNATVVANGGNGLQVSGSSMNTQVGGVIPLGNVISGNNRNGIEVKDRASGFVSFNTFAGTVAFGGAAPNRGNGILVTSTGGNNLIRTCIVSGNLGNGIEIGGNATGVQVTDTAVGTNSDIQSAIPNGGHGILFSGSAHGNAIGGFQPSLDPEVTVSANKGYGIAFVGKAHDNVVFHTFIGTKAQGTGNLGNTLGGILLDAGTRANTIGAQDPRQRNKIYYSGGNGVTIRCSKRAWIEGTEIVSNQGYGVYAQGNCDGSVIRGNVIASNVQGNVDLSRSRGVTYIP